MKLKKDKFREYKILKIVKNDKFYYRPMYRDDTLFKNKEWNDLYVWVEGTDYLIPCDYEHKFGAMRRIYKDVILTKQIDNNKFEIFEEIPIGKLKRKENK